MRNNSEHVGVEPQESAEIMPLTSTIGGDIAPKVDLGFPQPTQVVDLPSKGKFYPKSHPLYNCEYAEIRFMSSKDEEILNSKTLLQKGVAIEKMVEGLLVNKNIKLNNLFIGDKNALTIAARISAYDGDYKVSITCPNCAVTTKEHTFDLNQLKPKEFIEDLIAPDGTFEVVLPKSKVKVTLRLLTGNDEKSLKLSEDQKKRHNLPESPIRDQLKLIIVSVNNDNEKEVVDKFVDNMLAGDSKFVRDYYASVTPNVNMEQEFECPSCGTFSDIEIPMTVNFFWPKRKVH